MQPYLTHEKYVKKISKINPDIEILDTFYKTEQNIKCLCKIHNITWKTKAINLLNGSKCPLCSTIKHYTHEEFCDIVKSLHSNIEIMGTYKKTTARIKCKCNIDNHIWFPISMNLIRGSGCPLCNKKKPLSHQEFVEKIKILLPTIEILGEYITSKDRITCKCTIHNHIWTPIAGSLLAGKGCVICGGKNKRTHEEFISILSNKNPNIEVLGRYTKSTDRIPCRCKIDGYKWSPVAQSLTLGHGCPKCAGNIKKNHEEFLEEISKVNKDITILSKYKNSNTNIEWKCNLCNKIRISTPANLLSGKKCSTCKSSSNNQFK